MRFIIGLLFLALSSGAFAKTLLKSFSYLSLGCRSDGLMIFGPANEFRMGDLYAQPGANFFPTGNFWVRAVSLMYMAPPTYWALVGHGGPNGDVVSPATPGGTVQTISYPEDASPYFTLGEYFDVHANCQPGDGQYAYITFWYVLDTP